MKSSPTSRKIRQGRRRTDRHVRDDGGAGRSARRRRRWPCRYGRRSRAKQIPSGPASSITVALEQIPRLDALRRQPAGSAAAGARPNSMTDWHATPRRTRPVSSSRSTVDRSRCRLVKAPAEGVRASTRSTTEHGSNASACSSSTFWDCAPHGMKARATRSAHDQLDFDLADDPDATTGTYRDARPGVETLGVFHLDPTHEIACAWS